MKRLLCFLVLAPLVVSAEDIAAEYQKKLKKIEQDEGLGRVGLAKHCEGCKMWKEAVEEWGRVLEVFPDNKEAQAQLEKAQQKADVVVSRPTDADAAKYAAGLAALKKSTAKRWRELATWAKSKGLESEAEDAIATAEDLEATKKVSNDPRQRAVDWLNSARRKAKLKATALSEDISKGAQLHCEYLAKNEGKPQTAGLKAHEEDPSLPGYTPEGAKAGMQSDLGHAPPPESMKGMIGTFYHRIPLLHPDLKDVGIGYVGPKAGGGGRWGGGGHCAIDYSGLATEKDMKSPRIVAYPADKQTGVPVNFAGEEPDPLPQGEDGSAGYPITLTFFDEPTVTDARMEVRCDGVEVSGYFSSQESPARSDFPNEHSMCFIAKEPLEGRKVYSVKATATVDGEPFTREWSFTTGTGYAR